MQKYFNLFYSNSGIVLFILNTKFVHHEQPWEFN